MAASSLSADQDDFELVLSNEDVVGDLELARTESKPDPSTGKQRSAPTYACMTVKFATDISFVINIILFGAKIAATISSGSIAVLASCVDSFLDLLSGSIVWLTVLGTVFLTKRDLHNVFSLFSLGACNE